MNFTKSTFALAVSSLLICASFSSLNANAFEEKNIAASDVEVITVTSDFRQQNLLKTPSALSVLTDVEIKQRNAQNLEELVAIVPNVNFASGSQRARYYQIRGIGERSQFNEPINPSVGMIIDGIDFTGIGSIANLFDVQQAEVFRGPQGTRFGANALAGMFNITTNAPTDEFEGIIKVDAGNYNSYGLGLALSGPASDSVNYRLAANKYQSDGFIENSYLNKSNMVSQVTYACGTAPDRLHPVHTVLVDDGFLAVVLLHVDADRQHADDGNQREGNDAEADRQLNHCEPAPAPEICRFVVPQFHFESIVAAAAASTRARPVMWFTTILEWYWFLRLNRSQVIPCFSADVMSFQTSISRASSSNPPVASTSGQPGR